MKHTTCLLACTLFAASASARADNLDFAMGKALFDRPWTSAPAATQATDGLGPLFNARSCLACHPKSGRGEIERGENGQLSGLGYVLRIGNDRGEGDPVYGRQLQTNAIHGFKGEAKVFYDDGYYRIEDLTYGPFDEDTKFAGRLAQPLHGLGLLERIADETILANADPDDLNNDGISGRVHKINGKIGRFAWKATATSLEEQAANAFKNDIGMSTPYHTDHFGDCTSAQKDCQIGPSGASPQFENLEIDSQMLRLMTVYLKGLTPPKTAVRSDDGLFDQVGCAACHIPMMKTEDGIEVQAYTDLLLHDMGDDLADGIKEGDASGREWRTQPLWGTKDAKHFLHDGRAGSVAEAIQFHGGEAVAAKQKFNSLNETDKAKLLDFINSL